MHTYRYGWLMRRIGRRAGFAVGFLLVYCAYSWALELGIGIGLIVHIEYIYVLQPEKQVVLRDTIIVV